MHALTDSSQYIGYKLCLLWTISADLACTWYYCVISCNWCSILVHSCDYCLPHCYRQVAGGSTSFQSYSTFGVCHSIILYNYEAKYVTTISYYNESHSNAVASPGGCMWVHLHPIHAPVHPSYAYVVLFTYSLSQVCMFHYTATASNVTCHVYITT